MTAASVAQGFAPLVASSGKELGLAMQRLWLTGRILPAGARLMLRHVFRSAEPQPVEAVYVFALPRDAALRRFRVNGDGFSVRSELKPVEEAARLYERGLDAGHLATLARQYGDGIVNLSLGNLKPGETVAVTLEVLAGVEAHDDGLRFRFPFTLAPGYHPKARAAATAPGIGEIELPEEEFGDMLLPRWARDAGALHEVGFELEVVAGVTVSELGSPSHAVRVREEAGFTRVSLAPEIDVPDRDLVLDVRTSAGASVLGGTDRAGRGRFAVLVPSEKFGPAVEAPRRVVFLLDRSGSMNGTPLKQARKAVEACLGALGPEDRFGLVAFDDKTEVFARSLAPGTMDQREKALKFLNSVGARGGTELARAVEAAAKLLGSEGGDLMVLTDGQVFGTENILERARKAGARLHCLGIGSASQDRFLSLLARETGGVSRFLTPRERVDVPAVDLFASIGRPLASDIRVSLEGFGQARLAPQPPAHLFGGTPLVLLGETDGPGSGKLRIEWRGADAPGSLELPLDIPGKGTGETLRLLQGARLLTDLATLPVDPAIDRQTEELSREYGLASRRMALVAVVERAGDQPGEVPVTRVVPVGLPQDTPFEGYFGTAALDVFPQMMHRARMPKAFAQQIQMEMSVAAPRAGLTADAAVPTLEDLLLDRAAHLLPDGGMPGHTEEERIEESLRALQELLDQGNTIRKGPFRRHVRKLVAFLERAKSEDRRAEIDRLIAVARG